MKLEQYSKRSCCYIGFGEGSNNELSDRLWELVIGESRKKKNGLDVTYPLNLLFSKGRKPNVRFFGKESVVREPCEEVIDSNVKWLGMFTPEAEGEEEWRQMVERSKTNSRVFL